MHNAATLPARSQGYGTPRSVLIPIEAGVPMPELKASAIAAALAVAIAGTSISGGNAPIVRVQDVPHVAPLAVQSIAIVQMLRAIRRRTALTWDQLGSIFGVSRRSLHHWANGQAVAAENQLKVQQLHDRVLALADGPAFAARTAVLAEFGISQPVETVAPGGSPILVADQSPIAAKVSVTRSPRTRVR